MTWSNKTKIDSGTWSAKAKIPTVFPRSRILTHDLNQVMVGSSENEVLIWQEASDSWNRKVKIAA